MLDVAWNNLWRRKLRAVLTILGIAVALELVIVLTTILDFTERSMQGELAQYVGQMYVRSQAAAGFAGQQFPPTNSSLKEGEAQQIISEVAGRIDEEATTLVVFHELAPPIYPNGPRQALAVGVDSDKIRAYIGDDPTVSDGVLSFSGAISLNETRFCSAPR